MRIVLIAIVIFVSGAVVSCTEKLRNPDLGAVEAPESVTASATTTAKTQSLDCGPVPIKYRKRPYFLDEYYQQFCDADGLPVVASRHVNPLALKVVKDRAIVMMQKLSPKTKLELSRAKTRLAIIGKDELTTDIPEFHDLYEAFPETDWNVRARGLSATRKRPVTSVGEENILCLSKRHAKTDIFIHEFAHTIHLLGLNKADLTFEPRLIETYNRAIQRGLWKDTYAGSNFKEYWAEGVQSWFDLRGENQKGVHNHVNTRRELKRYDRALYDLIAEYMPDSHFAACPK